MFCTRRMHVFHTNTVKRWLGHRLLLTVLCTAALVALSVVMAGCASPVATQALIQVNITADGETLSLQLPPGSTVQQALDKAGISLEALDRSEPPVYTVLGDGASVRVIRVTEEYEVQQVVLPFEQQTLRNESLPVEQEVLIQRGKNGLQEITYRRVFEDGVEVSSQPIPVNTVIVEEPVPEIRMIGVQTPFSSVGVPGKLYYLRDGNLWLIEESTGNRRAVLTTGDLDGRILSFSDDGDWLLYTRRSKVDGRINDLWVSYIGEGVAAEGTPVPKEDQRNVDLDVQNVIHFADWVPGSDTKIVFSTVEPRPTAPGWQANNDLQSLTFSTTGWTTKWTTILEANSGGVYGWWGTSFQWSPDNRRLVYVRPDSIGLVDYKTGAMTNTLEIAPLQTRRDWAWVPGITWGPDGNALYTVSHAGGPAGLSPEESPNFDLIAVTGSTGGETPWLSGAGRTLPLASQTGMFAYPSASPLQEMGGASDYQIAYLQALFPEQSETSPYRLAVMDRDGSNRQLLFPGKESAGMEPQQYWGAWSPMPLSGSGHYALAVIYQGNLYLVDVVNGEASQVTGDGLTTRVIWR
jgi:hypothetical protein